MRRRAADVARRTIDVLTSFVLLSLLSLLLVGIALLVRQGSPGPALFRQDRIGLNGRSFTLFKFRTMQVGGDDRQLRELIKRELRGEDTTTDGSSKLNNDPRVTSIGRFLRKTSLDELPQLINVLRGDMTLVGPRPCLRWEAEMFPRQYASRFSVPPGLTGLWQVSGRSTLGTLEMLQLDVAYVERRSLRTDLNILLRTVPSLVRGGGAR